VFTELELNDSGLRVDGRSCTFITFVFYLLIYRDAGAGSDNFCKIATNYTACKLNFNACFPPVLESTLLNSVSRISRGKPRRTY